MSKTIDLKSDLLKGHFSDDSVSLETFVHEYECVKHVLDNPEKFPDAHIDYLIGLEEQFILEAPELI